MENEAQDVVALNHDDPCAINEGNQELERGEGRVTGWMSRLSDRYDSLERPEGSLKPRLVRRTGERNFLPNICVGESVTLAYSCPCVLFQCQVQCRDLE